MLWVGKIKRPRFRIQFSKSWNIFTENISHDKIYFYWLASFITNNLRVKRYFQNYFVPRVLKLSWRHNFASWWKILKYKKLEISRTWVFYEIKNYEIVPHRMKFQMSSFYADVTYVIYFMSIKYISSTKPTKFETYFEVGVH